MKRYDRGFWGVGFDGQTDLWIRTPWFALELAFEALSYDENKVWWGMKLAWSRRPNVKAGEFMFLRQHKVVFYEVSKQMFYQRSVGLALLPTKGPVDIMGSMVSSNGLNHRTITAPLKVLGGLGTGEYLREPQQDGWAAIQLARSMQATQ